MCPKRGGMNMSRRGLAVESAARWSGDAGSSPESDNFGFWCEEARVRVRLAWVRARLGAGGAGSSPAGGRRRGFEPGQDRLAGLFPDPAGLK